MAPVLEQRRDLHRDDAAVRVAAEKVGAGRLHAQDVGRVGGGELGDRQVVVLRVLCVAGR